MDDSNAASGSWIPKFLNDAKSSTQPPADPSIFADADDDVRIPSIETALRIQSDAQVSSAAYLLASANRIPSISPSISIGLDQKPGPSVSGTQVPSEWLRNALISTNLINQLSSPAPRSSSVEFLRNLGLLDNKITSMTGMTSTENLLRQQLGLTKPPTAPLASAIPLPQTAPQENREVEDSDIRDWDVLCGRGGKSNHHPGNKRYRQVVAEMKAKYRGTAAKTDKTALSRAIVDYVNGYGGRFIKKNSKAGKYILLTKAEARKKTSQALRETKELKWTL